MHACLNSSKMPITQQSEAVITGKGERPERGQQYDAARANFAKAGTTRAAKSAKAIYIEYGNLLNNTAWVKAPPCVWDDVWAIRHRLSCGQTLPPWRRAWSVEWMLAILLFFQSFLGDLRCLAVLVPPINWWAIFNSPCGTKNPPILRLS